MSSADHELSLEVPDDAVPVFGDADRLLTIVTNLLDNAIKYSPHGGLIRCAVSEAEASATVTVIDPGVGIASEDLPRLFGRFERISNPHTSHVGGTGLGLYLSLELARQHSGDIEVYSRLGVGSTFTLILPLTKPLPKTVQPAPLIEKEFVPTAPRLHVVAAEGEPESQPA